MTRGKFQVDTRKKKKNYHKVGQTHEQAAQRSQRFHIPEDTEALIVHEGNL